MSAPQQPTDTAQPTGLTAEATSDAVLSPAPDGETPEDLASDEPALPDADATSDDAVIEPVRTPRKPTTSWFARATSPGTISSASWTSSTRTATSTSTSRVTGRRSRSSAAS